MEISDRMGHHTAQILQQCEELGQSLAGQELNML
jgi:hypothetical protein